MGDFVWTAIDYLGESAIGHAILSADAGRLVAAAVSVVQLLLRRHRPDREQEAAVVLPRCGVGAKPD